MRIAFVDFSGWAYTADTPYQRPLGGSQSALCYLAEALAAQGCDVSLINGTQEPTRVRGVSAQAMDVASGGWLQGCDAVVVLNGCSRVQAEDLRQAAGTKPLMIYWTQHAHDQPASKALADPAMQALWDAFVLISDWQAECYRRDFGLPSDRVKVLRNAVGPTFARMFGPQDKVAAGRATPPVLVYTSTPFRGLDVLIEAFPAIRAAIPGTTLQVFSSLSVYQVDGARDPYADLYARCRATEGVEYVGSRPQPELAGYLRRATALAYPNTFEETACIAAMEAMAAGCMVISAALGALPETTAGYGFLMTPTADRRLYAERFADFAIRALRLAAEQPEGIERHLTAQVRHVERAVTWPGRAREWRAWLEERLADVWGRRNGASSARLALAQPTPLGGSFLLAPSGDGLRLIDAAGVATEDSADPASAGLLDALLRPFDVALCLGASDAALSVARRVGPGGVVAAIETDRRRFARLCADSMLAGAPQLQAFPALSAEAPPVVLDGLRLALLGKWPENGLPAWLNGAVARWRPFLRIGVDSPADFAAIDAACAAWGDYRLLWHVAAGFGGELRLGVLAAPREAAPTLEGAAASTWPGRPIAGV